MPKNLEHSSSEKRHWVRITRACNNRCMFCLDHDSLDGAIVGRDLIHEDLQLGIGRCARRVVISGGEPTIHPDFVDIVRESSAMGYTWVQTITNGRMFCYGNFLESAVAAGLKEVTFSIHGHTSAVFERLTGVKGSFKQTIAGLKNALNTRGLVVSVDIVINALNCNTLSEIVAFYHQLGVTEFDLLYPVPFGAAWRNRDQLLVEPEQIMPELHKTLAMGASHGLTFWTNRVPPALLEGFEGYIPSPKKLHDEVFARQEMFLSFLSAGKEPPCHGARCAHCHMTDFCAMLERLRAAHSDAEPGAFLLTAESIPLLEYVDPARVRTLAADSAQTAAHPAVQAFIAKHQIPFTVVFHRIPAADEFPHAPGMHAAIAVNKHTAPLLVSHGVPDAHGAPVSFITANYPDRASCRASAISPQSFFKQFSHAHGMPPAGVYDTAPCLSNAPYSRLRALPLCVAVKQPDWDLGDIVNHFISREYYSHSLRCRTCAEFQNCPGLHINFARALGFEQAGPRTELCTFPQ